jgi:hypothetical protein
VFFFGRNLRQPGLGVAWTFDCIGNNAQIVRVAGWSYKNRREIKREKTIFEIAVRALSFIKEGTRKYSIGLHNLIPKRPKQKEKQATQEPGDFGWKEFSTNFRHPHHREKPSNDRQTQKQKQAATTED